MEVQDDFRLATAADIVADPSAPDAYVKGIMENVDWVYDSVKGTWLEQQLEDEKREIRGLSRAQIEEQKLARFNSFIQSLKTI